MDGYEAHLIGGDFNVYGATFYGLPFIIVGFNYRVAWTLTRNQVDLADIFVEKLDSENPKKYFTPEGWRLVDEVEVDLKVRYGDVFRVL